MSLPDNSIICGAPPNHGTRPDWSAKDSALNNFGNRMTSAYLGKHWCSDMAFHIEDEDRVIPAHSLIVAAASPVLERCCFGFGNCVLPGKVIRVPNCSLDSFWVFLSHLYGSTDNDHQRDPDDPANIGLTIGNAAEVLRLADYYDLRQLRDICKKLLLPGLNVKNVCAIYDQVRLLEDQEVAERCMLKMSFNVTELFDSAMEMNEPAVAELLCANDLRVKNEVQLFDAMFDWGTAKCEAERNGLQRREVMQNRLQYVRFGTMGQSGLRHCINRLNAEFSNFNEAVVLLIQILEAMIYQTPGPFKSMNHSMKPRANKIKCVGVTKEQRKLMSYWCTPRAQIKYCKLSFIVAKKQYDMHWGDAAFAEISCKFQAPDMNQELALYGLTLPNFDGEIHVRLGRHSNEYRKLKTKVENDVVRFEPELSLDDGNYWDLMLRIKNPANRDVYELNPSLVRQTEATTVEKVYTMISAIHIICWKR